jgi:CRP-like cAMP-binding protein
MRTIIAFGAMDGKRQGLATRGPAPLRPIHVANARFAKEIVAACQRTGQPRSSSRSWCSKTRFGAAKSVKFYLRGVHFCTDAKNAAVINIELSAFAESLPMRSAAHCGLPMTKPVATREVHNRILLALPRPELKHILENATHVDLPRGKVLYRPNDKVEKIYFIDRGLISLVKEMRDGRSVEIGVRGIEAVTTPEALLDSPRAIFTNIVQIPCSAWVVNRQRLRSELEKQRAFTALLYGYFHVAWLQIAQTAACNRLHSLEERCCRWLLIAHDNACSCTFPLTHEFLAMMLGAPRSGVSIASEMLRKAGYIDYTRGKVTITNRAGLEAVACECYASIRGEFDRLFD